MGQVAILTPRLLLLPPGLFIQMVLFVNGRESLREPDAAGV